MMGAKRGHASLRFGPYAVPVSPDNSISLGQERSDSPESTNPGNILGPGVVDWPSYMGVGQVWD